MNRRAYVRCPSARASRWLSSPWSGPAPPAPSMGAPASADRRSPATVSKASRQGSPASARRSRLPAMAAVQRVGPDRRQHPPPASRVLAAVGQQALVGQPADQVGNLAPATARAHRHGSVQVEPADEGAGPPEHDLLVLVEQVMAPVDDRAQ